MSKRTFYLKGFRLDREKIRHTFPKEDGDLDENDELLWYQPIINQIPCRQFTSLIISPLSQPITIDQSAEAVLLRAPHKELAYLKEFGQPLLPFQCVRREGYQYEEQSPSDHVENLGRYLLIAPSLIPGNPALSRFCIRHSDLQQSNINISRSPDSNWQITSLIDWQHASILPLFLNALYQNAYRTMMILSRYL
jgi:hypothetical protein